MVSIHDEKCIFQAKLFWRSHWKKKDFHTKFLYPVTLHWDIPKSVAILPILACANMSRIRSMMNYIPWMNSKQVFYIAFLWNCKTMNCSNATNLNNSTFKSSNFKFNFTKVRTIIWDESHWQNGWSVIGIN